MYRRKMIYGMAAAGSWLRPRPTYAGADKPALLGGSRVKTDAFPSWPVADELEDQALLKVLRSGKWSRGNGSQVSRFEEEYAQLTGAKHCLAAATGHQRPTDRAACDRCPGLRRRSDPATLHVRRNDQRDSCYSTPCPSSWTPDPRTFQIDASKIEAAITRADRRHPAVHLGGTWPTWTRSWRLPQAQASGHRGRLPVAPGRVAGKEGGHPWHLGCFSFQATKNLSSGEGGAILTNDRKCRTEFCVSEQQPRRARLRRLFQLPG